MDVQIDYRKYLQSKTWKDLRVQVLNRSGQICERCGERPVEVVHHLTYDRVGSELLDDLLGVCARCHEVIHIENPELEPPFANQKRDYTRESKGGRGNSVSYVLRRLEKDAPEYLERVKAGEMSPNGAAVAAGLVDKKITVPAVASKAARVLTQYFRGRDLAELIDLLSSALSDEIDRDLNPGA